MNDLFHKTWDDVVKAAIGQEPMSVGNPLMYQAIRLVEAGRLTEREALIGMVLGLQQMNSEQHARILDLLNTRMPSSFILPKS